MLDAAEAARRRELHQRVYAPGGALTDAEIAELHDLENRNLVQPPVGGSQLAASDAEVAATRDPRVEGEELGQAHTPVGVSQVAVSDAEATAVRDPRVEDADVSRANDAGTPRAPRRRWMLPLVATIAVLVGLGAGWLMFGTGADRTTMNAAQQHTWSELEASGDYDPGSIHLVGEKYEATAWSATQDKGQRTCVILTRKDLDPAMGCRSSSGDYEGFDLQVSLDYTEDGDQYMLFAVLIEDAGGNPVTIIQQQNMTDSGWDWRSQYNEDELVQVDLLEKTGLDGEQLILVGYDGATPVWLYQGDRTCLMVVLGATDVAQECGTLTTDPDMPLQLTVDDALYSVIDSSRGPSLTILRSAAPTQVTCDTDTGDCTWVDDTPVEVG